MAETKIKEVLEIDEEALEAGRGTLQERALTRYRRHVLDNHDRMRDLVEHAYLNQDFISPLGTQWPNDIKRVLEELGIPQKGVNETWPVVAAISGRETTSRFQPKLTGRDLEDAGLSDAFNAGIRTTRDSDDWEQKDSAAFRQGNIQRVGAVHIYADVWSSKTPQFKIRRIPVAELLLDFFTTEVNQHDRRAIAYGRYMNKWEFEEFYVDQAPAWPDLVAEGGDTSDFEAADVWQAETWASDGEAVDYYRNRTREVFVVDFEWKERETLYQLEIPGEVALIYQQQFGGELPMDLEEQPSEFWELFAAMVAEGEQAAIAAIQAQQQAAPDQPPPPPPMGPILREIYSSKDLMLFKTGYLQITGRDFTSYYKLKPEVVYHASFVGDKVLRAGKRKDRDWSVFPLIPFMDDRPEAPAPYSVVDLLKPRQEWLNMFLALWIHTLAHMPKSPFGYDTEIGDPNALESINAHVTRGDRIVGIPGGQKALFPMPQGQIPDGIAQAWQTAMELVPGAAGQSRYGIGNVDSLSRTASRLVDQQLSAMNSTLGEAFDALRHFRRVTARKIIGMIIAYWSPEDFRRAAGQFAQYIPDDKSQWWKALEFDLVVGEEATTRDMAMSAVNSLVDTALWQWLADSAPEVIPKIMHPLWGSAADDLAKKIEENEPMRQLQAVAEAFGADPGELQAFLEGGAAQQEPQQ